jgi:hypothetical protein
MTLEMTLTAKDSLCDIAAALAGAAGDRWCVFDNTASGGAFENAWELRARAPFA